MPNSKKVFLKDFIYLNIRRYQANLRWLYQKTALFSKGWWPSTVTSSQKNYGLGREIRLYLRCCKPLKATTVN